MQFATERLTLPHPRMHKRTFVLEPLAEIAPKLRHPITGMTTKKMLEQIS
jgi:2-amino-4-hydroxy-6-hydroxymethyldihydropteridine diphosphokinase